MPANHASQHRHGRAREWRHAIAVGLPAICLQAAVPVVIPVADLSAQVAPADSLELSKRRAAAESGRDTAAYLLIPASSMMKVMPDRAPFASAGAAGSAVEFAVARAEVEAGQIIIAPLDRPLRDVTFRVSPLSGPDGAVLPQDAVTLHAMGYVRTSPAAELAYDVERVGWFPDPILPFIERFDVARDRVQTLWLSVHCPDGQAPGTYEGTVTVSPANAPPETIAVRVRVFDFSVPRSRSLPTYSAIFPDHLERVHGARWSTALYWKYVDFLHAHRVNMDNPYREHEAPPTQAQIERLVAGGQDAWALRFIRQPGQGFSDTGVDSADYELYLDRALVDAKAQLAALRQASAEDLAYVYLFDEVREDHFRTLLETVRRINAELPGVPVFTSAYDKQYGATSGLDAVIDGWIAIIANFNTADGRAAIEQVRGKGALVYWYTTVWPPRPYPNFFIEYDAIEARILMGAMTQKFGPNGFGYWALNFWPSVEAPISEGPYTDWNTFTPGAGHGEGNWIAAGDDGPITTIRFENFRDGLEDYEYYRLLEQAVAAGAQRGAPEALLEHARTLLAVPDSIVRELTDFTRDPNALGRHRLQVAEAIERLRH